MAKVKKHNADQFAIDAIDSLSARILDPVSRPQLSAGAEALCSRPLWSLAAECLQLAGQPADIYGDRELIARTAMEMGGSERYGFYSENEHRQYVQAAGAPVSRPGDFPNILSGLANKLIDTVGLDDDFAYSEISALLPGGLSDFKPSLMVNKGVVEELDEVEDAESFKELGLSEEVLSYIAIRRFGNKFGWTPIMIANDDLGALSEGMIGLREAWEVTQNRAVIDRFTANEALLDGNPLFANRPDVGSAANDNSRTGGAAPSDAEWEAMEDMYADIGGVATSTRVRGSLNVCFCPTGSIRHEAVRTFAPLNPSTGLEPKVANTTANVGIFRGQVRVVPDSELRASSTPTDWFGLRNPTRLNTATVVRAYFKGFGTQGRRETWYDPTNKTTWVSLEGRIAVAVKNWRYAVRNRV